MIHLAERSLRQALAEQLRCFGLTPQQAATLIAVGESWRKGLTHAEIALAINADGATTTGILQRLERSGWVTTEHSRVDGRSWNVELSAAGKYRLADVIGAVDQASKDATRMLSVDEKRTLAVLLRRMIGS